MNAAALVVTLLSFAAFLGTSADTIIPFNSTEDTIVKFLQDAKVVATRDDVVKQIGPFKDFTDEELAIHHNYTEMTKYLRDLVQRFPRLCRLHSIGKSVEGRELWVLVLSKTPRVHRPGVPEFKYVANMHGNEVYGREALLKLAELLLKNYGENAYMTDLLDTTRIHLMPSMNPDGYERSVEGDGMGVRGRQNAHKVDLNRNFPRRKGVSEKAEPETLQVMAWAKKLPFVLSANLHGGTSIANYPFDDTVNGSSKTGDHELFVTLAYAYARAHPDMHIAGPRCGESRLSDPPKGITNGAKWYEVPGGMQDWMYLVADCFEITVETNCFKYPMAKDLIKLWHDHKFSLLEYMSRVHHSIRGFITDSQTGRGVVNATISINNRGAILKSYIYGDYWRPITPGVYEVTYDHRDYEPVTETVVITADVPFAVVNVQLTATAMYQDIAANGASRASSAVPVLVLALLYLFP